MSDVTLTLTLDQETFPESFLFSFSFLGQAELKELQTSSGGTGSLSNTQKPQQAFVAIIISSKLPRRGVPLSLGCFSKRIKPHMIY